MRIYRDTRKQCHVPEKAEGGNLKRFLMAGYCRNAHCRADHGCAGADHGLFGGNSLLYCNTYSNIDDLVFYLYQHERALLFG